MKTKLLSKKALRSVKNKKMSKIRMLLKNQPLIIALLFGVIGGVTLMRIFAATTITDLGIHPQAYAQPNSTGRTIRTLKFFQGKLYAGYGDYGANTGPIAINPYNPSDNTFNGVVFTADTEAVWQYRQIGNSLYALSTDPKKSADYSVGVWDGNNVTWSGIAKLNMAHVFDIVTLTGNDLWVIGSKGIYAVAYRSTDNGDSWQEMLRIAPVSGVTNDFARFYGSVVLNGKLYVQARDYYGSMHTASKVYDGSTWSDGPNFGLFNHGEKFAGKAVFHGAYHASYSGLLKYFNGTSTGTALNSSIYDYTIDGPYIYALGTDGRVFRSNDLVSWISIVTVPTSARSIAVMGSNTLYIGTSDSKLLKVAFDSDSNPPPPSQTIDTTLPNISITSPAEDMVVTKSVLIQASATDNVAIAKLELYVDGRLVNTVQSSNLMQKINLRGSRYVNGRHTVLVKAYDTSGNTAQTQVTFIKQ